MAGGESATFYFDTNIENVVERVVRGLAQLQGAQKNQGTLPTPTGGGGIEKYNRDVGFLVNRTKEAAGEINKAFSKGVNTETLRKSYRDLVSGLERDLGILAKGRGLKVEVGLEYSKAAVREVTKYLNQQLSGAITAGADPKRVGATRGSLASPKNAAFSEGFKTPLKEARKLSGIIGAATETAAKKNTELAGQLNTQNAEAKKQTAEAKKQTADAQASTRSTSTARRNRAKQASNEAAAAAATAESRKNAEEGARLSRTEIRRRRAASRRADSDPGPLKTVEDRNAAQGRGKVLPRPFGRSSPIAQKALYDEVVKDKQLVENTTRVKGASKFILDTRGSTDRLLNQTNQGLREVNRSSSLFQQIMEKVVKQLEAADKQLTEGQKSVLGRFRPEAVAAQQARVDANKVAQQNRALLTDDKGNVRKGVGEVRGLGSRVLVKEISGTLEAFRQQTNGQGFNRITDGADRDRQLRLFAGQRESDRIKNEAREARSAEERAAKKKESDLFKEFFFPKTGPRPGTEQVGGSGFFFRGDQLATRGKFGGLSEVPSTDPRYVVQKAKVDKQRLDANEAALKNEQAQAAAAAKAKADAEALRDEMRTRKQLVYDASGRRRRGTDRVGGSDILARDEKFFEPGKLGGYREIPVSDPRHAKLVEQYNAQVERNAKKSAEETKRTANTAQAEADRVTARELRNKILTPEGQPKKGYARIGKSTDIINEATREVFEKRPGRNQGYQPLPQSDPRYGARTASFDAQREVDRIRKEAQSANTKAEKEARDAQRKLFAEFFFPKTGARPGTEQVGSSGFFFRGDKLATRGKFGGLDQIPESDPRYVVQKNKIDKQRADNAEKILKSEKDEAAAKAKAAADAVAKAAELKTRRELVYDSSGRRRAGTDRLGATDVLVRNDKFFEPGKFGGNVEIPQSDPRHAKLVEQYNAQVERNKKREEAESKRTADENKRSADEAQRKAERDAALRLRDQILTPQGTPQPGYARIGSSTDIVNPTSRELFAKRPGRNQGYENVPQSDPRYGARILAYEKDIEANKKRENAETKRTADEAKRSADEAKRKADRDAALLLRDQILTPQGRPQPGYARLGKSSDIVNENTRELYAKRPGRNQGYENVPASDPRYGARILAYEIQLDNKTAKEAAKQVSDALYKEIYNSTGQRRDTAVPIGGANSPYTAITTPGSEKIIKAVGDKFIQVAEGTRTYNEQSARFTAQAKTAQEKKDAEALAARTAPIKAQSQVLRQRAEERRFSEIYANLANKTLQDGLFRVGGPRSPIIRDDRRTVTGPGGVGQVANAAFGNTYREDFKTGRAATLDRTGDEYRRYSQQFTAEKLQRTEDMKDEAKLALRERLAQARARQAYRQQLDAAGNLLPGIESVGKGLRVDTRNGRRDVSREILTPGGPGLEGVGKSDKGYAEAQSRLDAIIAKRREAIAAEAAAAKIAAEEARRNEITQRRAAMLYRQQRDAQGKLLDGLLDLGKGFVGDTRNGRRDVFRNAETPFGFGSTQIKRGEKGFAEGQGRLDVALAKKNAERVAALRAEVDEAQVKRSARRFQDLYANIATRELQPGLVRQGKTNFIQDQRQTVTGPGGVGQIKNIAFGKIVEENFGKRTAANIDRQSERFANLQREFLDQKTNQNRLAAEEVRNARRAHLEAIRAVALYRAQRDANGQLLKDFAQVGRSGNIVNRNTRDVYKTIDTPLGPGSKYAPPETPGRAGILRRYDEEQPQGIAAAFARGAFGANFNGAAKGALSLQGALEGVAQAAGTTVKYGILGQAVYQLQGIFGQAVREVLDFDDSITNLNVALDSVSALGGLGQDLSLTGSVMLSLSDSASIAGANIGQSMDLAAAAVRAFADTTDYSQGSIDQLERNFTATASKLAVISNTDIKTAADNLQAIGLAFDIPDASFSRILDVVAGAKAIGGGNENDIATGLANAGVQFRELGFSAEEAGAIISKVQVETAQSGTLIASRLTRATSILGGSEGTNALRRLNMGLAPDQQIDTGADVKTKILQLSAVYDQLSKSQRSSLINSLGGATAARELMITLENGQDLVDKANDGFTGKGAEEYQRMLENINGTLRQIQGNLRNIVAAWANSGVLDLFIGILKYGLLPAVQVTKKLLEAFNLIPRPARSLLFAVLQISTVMALIVALGRKNMFGGWISSAGQLLSTTKQQIAAQRTALAQTRVGSAIVGVARTPVSTAAANTKNAVASGAKGALNISRNLVTQPITTLQAGAVGMRNALTTSASAVRSGFGKAVGAIGGFNLALIGITAAIFVFQKALEVNANTKALEDLNRKPLEDSSAANFRDQAANVRAAAENARAQSGGVLGTTGNLVARAARGTDGDFTDYSKRAIEASEALAEVYEDSAERIDEAIARVKTKGDVASQIDTSSTDALSNSLDQLSKSGYTAGQIIQGMTQRFTELVDRVTTGTIELNSVEVAQVGGVAGAAGAEFINKNQEMLKDYRKDGREYGAGKLLNLDRAVGWDVDIPKVEDYADVDTKALGARLNQQTTDFLTNGVTLGSGKMSKDINNDEARKILLQQYEESFKAAGFTDKDARDAAVSAYTKVRGEVTNLGTEELKAILADFYSNFTQRMEAAGSEAATNFAISGGSAARGLGFKSTASVQTEGKINYLKPMVDGAKKLEADAIAKGDMEGAAKYRQQAANMTLALNQLYVEQVGNDIADIAKDFELWQASQPKENVYKNLVEKGKSLQEQYDKAMENGTEEDKANAKIAIEENEQAKAEQLFADQRAQERTKIDPRDEVGQADQDLKDANAKLDDLDSRNVDKNSEEYQKALQDKKQAEIDKKNARIARAASERNKDLRDDDSLGVAKAALVDDEAALAGMKKGSTEYNEQLRKIANDRIELAKAQTETDISARNRDARNDDSLDAARRNLADEQDRLKNFAAGTKEYDDQQKKINDARLDLAKQQTEFAISGRNTNVLGSSSLDTAQRALKDAEDRLKNYAKDSIEYNNQLAVVNQAQLAVATATAEANAVQRNLAIDLTDPVATAREAVTAAEEKLKNVKEEAARSNASPEAKAQAIGAAELEKRSAQNQAEAAEFSQFLQSTQTANDLGRISHRAYLQMLRGRRDQLAAELATMKKTDNGYQQIKDQIDQLDQAIKAGADELSGQFNIGDIKIPTPYEVRRAIKEKNAGTVLANNAATSTAGNVTTDNSTKNVVLNGVPIQQVMAMIEDLFGVKTRATKGRKVV